MGTKEKEGEEPELIPVGDGAETPPEAAPGTTDEEQRAARAGDGDEERGGEGEEAERGGDDERLGRADDNETAEQRRETRAQKNERRRRAMERDRTELRYLRSRNEVLERQASENAQRLDRIEKAGEDERINRIRSAIRNADATIVKLTAAGEEAQALEATTIKNNMQEQLDRELRKVAERDTKRAESTERVEQPREEGGLSPTAQRNALAWKARNGWFNADNPGSDERVAHALDAAILAEGYDPEDPEYYRELDRRVAEYMPHRAQKNARRGGDEDDERGGDREERRPNGGERPRRDAPRFRVGGRERALKPNEVYLSRARREALEEMGANDDPVLMKRYLKSFKKYDEDAAKEAARRE